VRQFANLLGVGDTWEEATAVLDGAKDAALYPEPPLDLEGYKLSQVGSKQGKLLSLREDSDESSVTSSFNSLIESLGELLCPEGVGVEQANGRDFTVGGMLALPTFAVGGRTDPTYALSSRQYCSAGSADGTPILFTAEFKRGLAYPESNLWYKGSRGRAVGHGALERNPVEPAGAGRSHWSA
jgi:hypothetical protein